MRRRSDPIKRASAAVFSLILLVTSVCSLGAIEPCVSNLFPVVSITKPTNGQRFTWSSTVRIRAVASDPDGSIARVEFFADGNYLGSATNAPYTNNWPQVFSGSPAIPFLLTARAIDTCGAVSTSAPVAIYVIQDIHPPLVVIEKPLDGALYRPSAPIQILASVRPSDGSENPVSFYAGSNLLGVAPEPPYSLTVSNLPPGRHMITAENTDDFYQTGSSRPIALTVVDLVLDSPRFDIGGRFKFNVTGVATGSSLVLLGSSNLFSWEPIATNFPVTPQLELVVESPERQAQRYFRVVGEK